MDDPNTILKFNILNLIQIEIHIYVYKVVLGLRHKPDGKLRKNAQALRQKQICLRTKTKQQLTKNSKGKLQVYI